jgi:hypothetical protein
MTDTALNILKGLTPTRKLGSNRNAGGLNVYPVSNGYATAIGNGDPVKLSAGKIELATNAGAVLGTLQGVMYIDTEGQLQVKPNFVAATSSKGGIVVAQGLTQVLALVNDDPNQTYAVRTVDAASVSAGMIGRSFKVSAIGSVVGGRSQCVLDVAASAGTSGGHMITVVGLWSEPGNDWGNAPTAVEVKLSNHGIIGEL